MRRPPAFTPPVALLGPPFTETRGPFFQSPTRVLRKSHYVVTGSRYAPAVMQVTGFAIFIGAPSLSQCRGIRNCITASRLPSLGTVSMNSSKPRRFYVGLAQRLEFGAGTNAPVAAVTVVIYSEP